MKNEIYFRKLRENTEIKPFDCGNAELNGFLFNDAKMYQKQLFISEENNTGCKFITVDAFKTSIDFYLKNGFEFISSRDKRSDTRQMYYDLLENQVPYTFSYHLILTVCTIK
ncbi:hypothetical protein Barb6_01770 [Bacteroidales bacterium Barb6]|nr:hypothetical protein Barb6_01770 [Bacteroidales bacterium Barb6]